MDVSVEFETVVQLIEESPTFEVLLENWRLFSRSLGLNEAHISELERKLNLQTLPLGDLPREILKIWKEDEGNEASLDELQQAFVDSKLNDIADSLLTSFPILREQRKRFKFLWRGNTVTLRELLGKNTTRGTYRKIRSLLVSNGSDGPFQLLKDRVIPPAQSTYYVPRTLSREFSTEVNPQIFMSHATQNHVFLLKGMNKSGLARLTHDTALMDLSGNQLLTLTTRFILLEDNKHFKRICRKTNHPVHVIRQNEEGLLFWVKSNKGLDVIKEFLRKMPEDNNCGEHELAMRIKSNPPPFAWSISGSPGTGKTLLLVNLARNVQKSCPLHTIHLFIALREFVPELGNVHSTSSALEAIASYSGCNDVSKLVLLEMIERGKYQLYLFLDGYDQVDPGSETFVDAFLKHMKKLRNVRIIITTRAHAKTQLELNLKRFTFDILPFTEAKLMESQLTSYWIDKFRTKSFDALEGFAKSSLASLDLNDAEKEIVGIPLLCLMLREVYEKDAKRALHTKCEVKQSSLFSLFRKLIESKFNTIREQNLRKKYCNAHVYHACIQLVPACIELFKPILKGYDEVDESTLYSIGLLERSPPTPPRFIHQTFAEYLLTGFIVDNLSIYRECFNFLFTQALGRNGVRIVKDHIVNFDSHCNYNLKFPDLANFIEMHMQNHTQQQSFQELLQTPRRFAIKRECHDEDICIAITTCASNDLQYTFDYVTTVSRSFDISIGDKLRAKYFRYLPYAVIQKSRDVTLLEKLLEFTCEQFQVDLSYHDINECRLGNLNVATYTLLHEAVRRGKHSMVEHLIQTYWDRIESFKFLLHICVLDSALNTNAVLEDKEVIIDKLVQIKRNWLKEMDEHEFGCTPLLQQHVHLRLLQRLIDLGADINSCSSIYGTVLHRTGDENTYGKLVSWAFSNGFNLINHTDRWERTLLMYAIKRFGSVSDEVLKIFVEAGARLDFNDANGDSLFFLALDYVENLNFINNLLGLGAGNLHGIICHKNLKEQNVMHKLMQGSGLISERVKILDKFVKINRGWIAEEDADACTPVLQDDADFNLIKHLVEEHNFEINALSGVHGTVLHRACNKNTYTTNFHWALSEGFRRLNHRNRDMVTPLMHAIKTCGILDSEVLRAFQHAGADFDAEDKNGDSVLFYALQYSENVEWIEKLLHLGADVHHTNHLRQNPAHVIMNWWLDSKRILNMLQLLDARGFTGNEFRGKDSRGFTPLEIGKKRGTFDKSMNRFLKRDWGKVFCSIFKAGLITVTLGSLLFGCVECFVFWDTCQYYIGGALALLIFCCICRYCC